MFRTDVWALPPGITGAVETYEAAFRWGPAGLGLITSGYIYSAALDPGNGATTFELRPGLVLGQRISDGSWTNYNPAATDGSEVAAGVNITAIRMTDILTQQGQARFYGVLVGGPVQASKLIGLDLQARADMDKFDFDDAWMYAGNHWFPWRRFQSKTASYQVAAVDNFSMFDNTGAAGTVTFTLPPIANGYAFGFRAVANQTIRVQSTEGGNMIALNNAAANNVTFSTGSQIIGANVMVYSNPAATQWVVENNSAGANTVTVNG